MVLNFKALFFFKYNDCFDFWSWFQYPEIARWFLLI